MKALKRIISVGILSAMLFAFAACGKTQNNPGGGNAADYDFDGATIDIYCDENTGDPGDGSIVLSYNSTSAEADALRKRISELEQNYNCTIKITPVLSDIEKQVSSLVASNSKGEIDLIFARSYYLRKWGNADYLVDVMDYADTVDYTDSFRWGTKNTLELLTCKGKLIGVTPACFVDQLPPFYYVLVANDNIVERAGFSNPNVYLEEGTWNRDTFADMVRECTDASTGVYGLDTGRETFLTLAMLSNGATLYDPETGVTGYRSSAAARGLDWGVQFLRDHASEIYDNAEYHEKLYEGNAALGTVDAVSTSNKVANNNEIADSQSKGFSILNFPYGPDADENTACGYISTTLNALCIPIIASDVEASAVVMEYLFSPMDLYPDFESLKSYYKNNIYWDDNDVELIFSLAEKAEYNYWVEGMSSIFENIAESAYVNGAQTALSASVDAIDNVLKTGNVITNKEGFETYWD